jgi:hypothetical protein
MRGRSFRPNARIPGSRSRPAARPAAERELLLVSLSCVQWIEDGVPAVLLPCWYPAFPPFRGEPELFLPAELAAAIQETE